MGRMVDLLIKKDSILERKISQMELFITSVQRKKYYVIPTGYV